MLVGCAASTVLLDNASGCAPGIRRFLRISLLWFSGDDDFDGGGVEGHMVTAPDSRILENRLFCVVLDLVGSTVTASGSSE